MMLASALRSLATRLRRRARPLTRQELLLLIAQADRRRRRSSRRVRLRELASERRWADAFGGSQEKLARLAQEALAEYEAGRTKPL